ncbi:2-dehydropantoate 2-reductase, partial [Burkholderia contaminans]
MPRGAGAGWTAGRLVDVPLTQGGALRMMEEAAAIGAKLGLSTGIDG